MREQVPRFARAFALLSISCSTSVASPRENASLPQSPCQTAGASHPQPSVFSSSAFSIAPGEDAAKSVVHEMLRRGCSRLRAPPIGRKLHLRIMLGCACSLPRGRADPDAHTDVDDRSVTSCNRRRSRGRRIDSSHFNIGRQKPAIALAECHVCAGCRGPA